MQHQEWIGSRGGRQAGVRSRSGVKCVPRSMEVDATTQNGNGNEMEQEFG